MLRVDSKGPSLLRDPLLNKGTAFTEQERRHFQLEGLLPRQYNSLALQAKRRYAAVMAYQDPMDRYVALSALQDRNEHLFYRVLCDHLEELMPIVYTPTVGQATQRYSEVFRRGRGVWITPDLRGRIRDVLASASNWCDVSLLVVTDNESILGIGDQGAGGIAISIGKLSLYCAGAGIHPARTLPVSLDVGTNNQTLLEDEMYLGWPHPRLQGEEYDALVEEFVEAVTDVFPGALVQWEDFRHHNALRILERYRDRVLSFNDDIQGTGAVALAGVLSALRATDGALADQRVVILGAGAAGLGIARQLRAGMRDAGLSEQQARSRLAILDSRGLLVDDRELGTGYKQELAWPAAAAAAMGLGEPTERTLHDVIAAFRPAVLIGAAGQAGAFDELAVREMARHVARPIILPFSNPTSIAEARPDDLIAWTDGKALVATGSPFEPVEYDGRTIQIGQGNNVFIFPGLGMGALLCHAKQVSDGMISAASSALAQAMHEHELKSGLLFPAVSRLAEVSARVAAAVMARAGEEGNGDALSASQIELMLERHTWDPQYPELVLEE